MVLIARGHKRVIYDCTMYSYKQKCQHKCLEMSQVKFQWRKERNTELKRLKKPKRVTKLYTLIVNILRYHFYSVSWLTCFVDCIADRWRATKVCYLYPLFYLCPLFSQLVTAGYKGDVILISWLESSIGRLCGLMSL